MTYKTYITNANIIYSIIILLLSAAQCGFCQITLNNPSFEDTPSDATTPMGWLECQEYTTPDILPGYWGVYTEPSEGETYVGMITRENGTFESIGQRLSATLQRDMCYSFTLDLAHSLGYTGYNQPIRLRIWLGRSKCETRQMIFESPLIDMVEWNNYKVEFRPENDVRYILLEAYHQDGSFSHKANILIDNISTIESCNRV